MRSETLASMVTIDRLDFRFWVENGRSAFELQA
jgi:hypothetical protein